MRIHSGRPTVAEIDRAALRENYRALRAHVPASKGFVAVVKANGYGHGGAEAARVFEKEGATVFGVATVEEGVELRDAGVAHPQILVLGGFTKGQVEAILHHRLTPVVSTEEMAIVLQQRLRGYPTAYPVHLKVDTGLGRLGPILSDFPEFLEAVKKLDRLEIEGLCSHPASASRVEGPYIDDQVAAFIRAGELCAIHGTPVKVRHLANSWATMHRPDLHFDQVRPGLSLYGLHPEGATSGPVTLRPAMTLKSSVLTLRTLPEGYGVGYDQTFVTQRRTRLATLPIGYADGLPRSLSNKGCVLVRGQRAPIVGAVAMDQTMVDVTDVPGVEMHDEVVLWGRQQRAELRADEVAKMAGTISYELVTRVSSRVPRIYRN